MKIVVNSDTHNQLSLVKNPECDLYIHCGDWTMLGRQPEMIKFGKALKKVKAKHKLIIPGNHDLTTEKGTPFYHEDWEKWVNPSQNTSIIINDYFKYKGLNFFCTSIVNHIGNPFRRWAREISEKNQEIIYDMVTEPIDILISHSPPHFTLDENGYGSKALAKLVDRLKPKYHIFGHAHDSYGRIEKNGTIFINAAIMNREYELHHEPVILEI